MALTKFASFEVSRVLDVKSAPSKSRTASLRTLSDFHDYRTEDGYLYVRIRAISSRTNKNHDGWPTAELAGGAEAWEKHSASRTSGEGFRIEADTTQEYGFPTFIGKPIFVDHNNSNPERARGVIVDSAFNVLDHKTAAEDDYWGSEDIDPEHNPPAEVELLLEVDAEQFPKFAKAIVDGDLDGFSMGCDVDYSKCSHCGNKASSPDEYCSHIVMKGAEHTIESGHKAGKTGKSYENCYGIKFFEISGVFDPADETALTKEIRSSIHKEAHEAMCPHCAGTGTAEGGLCPTCQGAGSFEAGDGTDGVFNLNDQQQGQLGVGQPLIPGDGGTMGPGVEEGDGSIIQPSLTLPADRLRKQFPKLPRTPIQGSFLASRKTAQPEEPQSFHTTAPEDVDTLREEKVCPLCGSDMDAEKCAVCGYEEPPEQLQNPDLQQAQMQDELGGETDGQVEAPDTPPGQGDAPDPGAVDAQSYLNARKPQPTASVKSDMRWEPKGIDKSKLAAAAAPRPSGDEPNETVTSDQTTPVTSAFRTATDLIAAAKRNQENKTMSDQTKVAADPADASGKADKSVDVTGVGGVMDATNEQASKPEGPHSWENKGTTVDVEGKGAVLEGTNEEASKPSDGTESLGDRQTDNAGFQPGGQKGDKTKTWNNSNEPGSAVTDKAVQSAKKGTDPIDKSGKPDSRVDVEEEVKYNNPQTMGIDQWTGTDGNGVTRQQDPVTRKVDPNIEQPKSSGFVSIAAIRLADTEVELGITSRDEKFNRLAELSELSDAEIAAETRALAKVKTAGLSRTASKGGTSRMPSFKRIASEAPAQPQPVNDALLDNALFTR